ncbi:MAG TPA: VWA domain-containing protein, partial [Treponemataceae bacterium]|nr:VWA domain-containing protein [Treponemataceae bacterium]
MKSLKKVLALIAIIGALSPVFGAESDIVVLMDTSGTILPFFEEINGRILVDITKKFVRPGDTFHLISFNSRVNLEIVQPINTEADLSRVVSRFMLLYPLGQNSDFISGLHYTWQYVSSLDQLRN